MNALIAEFVSVLDTTNNTKGLNELIKLLNACIHSCETKIDFLGDRDKVFQTGLNKGE